MWAGGITRLDLPKQPLGDTCDWWESTGGRSLGPGEGNRIWRAV